MLCLLYKINCAEAALTLRKLLYVEKAETKKKETFPGNSFKMEPKEGEEIKTQVNTMFNLEISRALIYIQTLREQT